MIVAPNSPSPRAKERASPATRPPRESGRTTRKKVRTGPAPSVRDAAVRCGSVGLEDSDRLPDVERAGDVRDGDGDRGLGERQFDPERAQARAEQAEAAERGEQPDARDGGRQHERQLDERDRERVAQEAARREQVCRRRTEEDDRRLRDEARLQGDDERVGDDRVRELVDDLGRRGVGEDSDDRQREKGERHDRNRDEEPETERAPHRSPRPSSSA